METKRRRRRTIEKWRNKTKENHLHSTTKKERKEYNINIIGKHADTHCWHSSACAESRSRKITDAPAQKGPFLMSSNSFFSFRTKDPSRENIKKKKKKNRVIIYRRLVLRQQQWGWPTSSSAAQHSAHVYIDKNNNTTSQTYLEPISRLFIHTRI
jgi:hypothetical protein